MKTLLWTFFILGMLLNAAVWWATEVKARDYWQQRHLFEPTGTGARKERPLSGLVPAMALPTLLSPN